MEEEWDIISLEEYYPPNSLIELQPLISVSNNCQLQSNPSQESEINEDDSTIDSLSPMSISSQDSINSCCDHISITVESPELKELCELFPYENEDFLYTILLENNYNIKSSLNQICENGRLIRKIRNSIKQKQQLSDCWEWFIRIFCCSSKHSKDM
tara:strand:+ start:316 stop:783 length:468 start_codon:yes stop_codon:yes gene_type:complete